MTERRFKTHPVAAGSILRRATATALRKRGFGEGEVIARWPEIVGPRLAALTAPEKLQQRRGDLAGAVLHIRVAGAAAVELQHMAPTVIERINGFYGYRAVDRLKLQQGPLPVREEPRPLQQRALTAAESAAVTARTAGTRNTALRQALARLGSHVLARRDTPSEDA
ncbi:MAG: DciA family protein [Proteobacteria bacterium]|nr:DciA family protein [Pseudomonadota bacterium]